MPYERSDLSIRQRLTLWYIGLLAVVLIALGGFLYSIVNYTLMREVDRTIQDRAHQVEGWVRSAAKVRQSPLSLLLPSQVILPPTDVFSSPNIYAQVLTIGAGEVEIALKSDNLGSHYLPLDMSTLGAVRQGASILGAYDMGGTRIRTFSMPLVVDQGVVGIVQVGQSLGQVDSTLRNLAYLLGAGIAITLLLAALIGAFLARQALRPIDEMTQTALEISRTEDLGRRLEGAMSQDEVGRLASTFNEMLERLEKVFRTQQRFIADVSHELRTPLTTVRGNLDILRRVEAGDKTLTRESLQAIEHETARMSRLVSDLLLLAQADAGVKLEREPVELDTLLLEVYRQALDMADGVEVVLGHEDQAMVLGNADRLRQLLLNLVDNALKYTPAGGKVTLSLYREDGWVKLMISDTGIGIPPSDLPHIFERFYVVDKARSRGKGGTGLGLSIVKWIAEAHGGRVAGESQLGKGSTFTLWLPEER